MEEVKGGKTPINQAFAYEVISTKIVNDKETQYSTQFADGGLFVALGGSLAGENPYGWKVHISLFEDDENISKAWNSIVDILIKYGIQESKVLKKGLSLPEFQKGKEITIYFQEGNIDWLRMFVEIEEKLLEEKIKPGYKALIDKIVGGSQFLSCRCERDSKGTRLTGLDASFYNPSGKSHIFELLEIVSSRLVVFTKPPRKNEERVIEFYTILQKDFFEIYKEFVEKFNRFNKSPSFLIIEEDVIENNYRGFSKEVSDNLKEVVKLGKELQQALQEPNDVVENMTADEYYLFFQDTFKKSKRIKNLMEEVSEVIKVNAESPAHSSEGTAVVHSSISSGSEEEKRSSSHDNADEESSSEDSLQEDFTRRMPMSPRGRT